MHLVQEASPLHATGHGSTHDTKSLTLQTDTCANTGRLLKPQQRQLCCFPAVGVPGGIAPALNPRDHDACNRGA